MNQQQKKLAAVNKLVITTIVSITGAATLGNTIGVFKGEKTIPVTLLFLILGLGTSINSIWLYKKDAASEKIKLQGCVGFLIMYAFTVFSAERNLVFIYVIPLLYIYTMYYDLKFIQRFANAFVAISLIGIVNWMFIQKINTSNDIMNYVIQAIATVIVATTSVLTCKLTNQFNQDELNQQMEINEKQKVILQEVLAIGGILDNRSKEIYSIVSELQDSSETMTVVMDAMSSGMKKTTDSIESQTELTKDIQESIADTSSQAKEMDKISNQSIAKIEEGVRVVRELTKNTRSINGSSKHVADAMNDLKDKTTEINRITDVITSIAKKINILSLNASIESARAGEAGKSFAVVATEIGALAAQTTESVSGISAIILELQSVVETVFVSLQEFGAVSKGQNTLINSTEEIFAQINENMSQVNAMVSTVTGKVDKIFSANEKVMQNIDTLISESMDSKQNIESTTVATEKNLAQVDQAKEIADELLAASERLQQYI